jgi:phage/plasmid-associated DNA primase
MDVILAEFRTEFSGIFNFAIRGLYDCRENGFFLPARVQNASAEYRGSEDILADFISSCKLEPNAEISGKELYQKYLESSAGKPIGQRTFYESLRERGFCTRKGMKGLMVQGICLSTEMAENTVNW